MTTVIVAYGPASGSCIIDGEYLVCYDPDAFLGGGDATFSNDIESAMLFETQLEALEFAYRRSTVRPLRADGQPNRPLTAFHLEFRQI